MSAAIQEQGQSGTGRGPVTGVAVRVIPCLDVKDGRVVKGVNFQGLRDAGDPVACARRYAEQGADEVTFLDISASHEGRDTLLHIVEDTARALDIPLTVGGGVRGRDDVRKLLLAGADKVSVNSAAVAEPSIVADIAATFGSQVLVLAIDGKRDGAGTYEVYTHGGRRRTGLDAVLWAKRCESLGAGEILLTSMDRDGTRCGYDTALTQAIVQATTLPVIASGGVGELAHLVEGIAAGGASAVLAASIFHEGQHTVREVKRFMAAAGLRVRP